MPVQIQLRHGTAAEWTAADPTLAEGEAGVETDTGKFKMGDGSTAWTSLPYSSGIPGDPGDPGAPGEGVPAGGATGEALVKASADDYDTEWAARLADTGVITYLDGTVAAAPGTPAAGKLRVYAKTGKVLAVKDDTGAETELGAGGGGIPETLIDAKGDLIVGTADNTAARLAIGSNAHVLTADSGETGGMKWAAAPGGGVATDPIWDAAGDLAVGSGANTAARLAKGSDDEVLTMVSGAPAWAAASGGGGSPFYLDTIALHGTYGDDFAAATLDGKWTLQGFEANSKLVPEANLGLRFSDDRVQSARSIWQAFTNKDEAEIIAAFTMDSYGANEGWGPYIVDSTGTGIGVGLNPSTADFGASSLSSYYGGGWAALRAVRASIWDLGALVWVSIYKRSLVYHARFSFDGTRWGQLYSWTPSAFTAAKIGFGRLYASGGGGEELIFLRRFNVINDFNLGNNLVITPTSGTATYSASSVYGGGGYEADKAADGNYGTAWAAATANTDNPAYWRCAWSVGQSLNRVRLWGRDTAMRHGYLDLYDGASHVYVPFPNQMIENGRVWVDFPTATGITQLNVCSGGGSAGAAGFFEVEAYLAS